MFFSSRNLTRLKIALLAVAIFGAIVGLLAALLPRKGGTFLNSYLWWLLGLPLALIAGLGLEWIGTNLLGLSFWQKVPSSARIALLVAAIVCVVIAAIFVGQHVAHG